jgi:predicted transcriptional regulator
VKDATIGEIKTFFNMTAGELMPQWKKLSDEEKAFFKQEVGKVINSED